MAEVPEKVLNWLYSVLTSEYADVNRTYHDAAEALANHPSLSPRTEIYTYENGASALLLLLSGTLPVTFRGATYGFPVAIWVPYAYPREPPMVYVTPSQDMIVRPGQHVSGDGRIYHPYLAQWGKYWDVSTESPRISEGSLEWVTEPGVEVNTVRFPGGPSRRFCQRTACTVKATTAALQCCTRATNTSPIPPPPTEWRRSVQSTPGASASPNAPGQGSAPPPRPPKPGEQSRPTPQPQTDRYSQPPPLPPHPPQQAHAQQRYPPSQQNNRAPPPQWQQQQQPLPHQNAQYQAPGYDMGSTSQQPRPPRPQVQPQGYHPKSYEIGSPVSPLTPEGQRVSYGRQPMGQPAPPNMPPQQYQGAGQAPHQQQQQYARPPQYSQQQPQGPPPQGYPHPQHQHQQYPLYQQPPQAPAPRAPINLLDDSLEVTLPSQKPQAPLPVPPVPPNPEKDALLRALSQTLTAQTVSLITNNQTALPALRAQAHALQTAHARLNAELHDLTALDAALASNESVLQGAMRDVDRVMSDAKRRQAPAVDDVLVAPTVVGGQLYVLAAEEKAVAEAMFVLGRGVERGRVGGEVFVKQTRSLAREQFLKKALIKKIAKGMGLDEYAMR